MDCDGSTTDDDATEDEEEKMPVNVTSESNGNNENIKAKWYGIRVVLIELLRFLKIEKSISRKIALIRLALHILIRCQSSTWIETLLHGDKPCWVM